ncbi:MAG: hypothetical protein ACJ8C4_15700 [Gemmataceae bacterium]
MESYLAYFGAVGSVASMLATLYFWVVRVRREQPSLKPYLIDKEFFLGNSRDGVRQVGIKIGLVVANYSALPNAILGARMWIRLKKASQKVAHLKFDLQTPQPFNLSPLNTALLRLTGTLSFPYRDDLEAGGATLTNYLTEFLAQPLRLKLELQHLNDRVDVAVLTWPDDKRRSNERRSAA